MKSELNDIDGKAYYTRDIDPHAVFNKLEITLSHLFRNKTVVLGNRTYSDCLFEFLLRNNYLKSTVVEVGCGLGDIASNLLTAGSRNDFPIEKYIMVDISPKLLKVQRERLGDRVNQYILGDCLELSTSLEPTDGMILSNALIADLRAIFLRPHQSLADYGIDDRELDEFAQNWAAAKGGGYVHIGPILFLRQVHKVLKAGGTAAILEFAATPINQPSFFYDQETGGVHTKCGIEFAQIASYASRLGLEARVVPIEAIWGTSPDQEFLTVDVFVCPDKVAREVSLKTDLLKLLRNLPVVAYTRESFREVLASDRIGLRQSDAEEVAKALDGCFHSIHDPRFDATNPNTWGYKCLLLRKG